MRFKLYSAVFSGSLLCTVSAMAMDMSTAVQKVLSTNPELLSAKEKVEQARQSRNAGWSNFLPDAEASASFADKDQKFNGGTTTSSNPATYQLSIEQPLFAGFGNISTLNSLENSYKATKAGYDNQTQEILLNLVSAYFDTLRDQDVLELQKNQVKVLEEQRKATQIRFEEGEVTKTDLKQAEARLARAKAEKIKAEGDLAATEARLEAIVGEDVQHLSWPRLNENNVPNDVETVRAMTLASHPLAVSALANLTSRKHNVTAEKSGFYPTVSLVGTMSKNEGVSIGSGSTFDSTEQTVTLQVSVPLFKGGATLAGVREAASQKREALNDYENTRRNISEELTSAFRAYEAAKASLDAFKQSQEAAKLAAEGITREAELGERSVLDVLDVQQDLLEAQVDVVRGKRDVAVTQARLLAAMGRLNADSLMPVESGSTVAAQ